jgi:hypothetical protein
MNHPQKVSQDDECLQRMRSELKELLGRSPGAREVLLHLAGLERALKTLGNGAFEGLPSHVLKRTATQLESVLSQPVGAGMAEIQARIAKVLKAHEQASLPAAKPAAAAPAPYFSDDKLQVSETTHTDFMRVLEATKDKY